MNFLKLFIGVEKNGDVAMERYVPFCDYDYPGGGEDLDFWRVRKPWGYSAVLDGLLYLWNSPVKEYKINEHTTLLRDRRSSFKCVNDAGSLNYAGIFPGILLENFDDSAFDAEITPLVRITVREAIQEGKRPPEEKKIREAYNGPEDIAKKIYSWLYYITGEKTWEEIV